MSLQYKNYLRMLELFAALHEEVGEAQKAFNDLMWNRKGRNIDVVLELDDILPILKEMRKFVYKPMSCKNTPLSSLEMMVKLAKDQKDMPPEFNKVVDKMLDEEIAK